MSGNVEFLQQKTQLNDTMISNETKLRDCNTEVELLAQQDQNTQIRLDRIQAAEQANIPAKRAKSNIFCKSNRCIITKVVLEICFNLPPSPIFTQKYNVVYFYLLSGGSQIHPLFIFLNLLFFTISKRHILFP